MKVSAVIFHYKEKLSSFSCFSLSSSVFPLPVSHFPYSMEKPGEQVCDANEQNNVEKTVGERKVRRICVFCGSSSGNRASFSAATLELGRQLVERKIDLVYGGGSVGLMGLISHTVFNGGCHVIGVIPRALLAYEISGETIGEVKVVADMHERKSEMSKLSDAFIALPGGYGTMEELLEVIAWSQLGIHDKPVGLLNVDGYYNSLLALFDKGVEEGFIDSSAQHIVVSAETAEELMTKMEAIDIEEEAVYLVARRWGPPLHEHDQVVGEVARAVSDLARVNVEVDASLSPN